jgi:hypothetical protein
MKKVRQAALVPASSSGLEGQLAGMILSTIKYLPSTEEATAATVVAISSQENSTTSAAADATATPVDTAE